MVTKAKIAFSAKEPCFLPIFNENRVFRPCGMLIFPENARHVAGNPYICARKRPVERFE